MIRIVGQLVSAAICVSLAACSAPTHQAETVEVTGSDVPRFYAAVDRLSPSASADAVREALNDHYIAPGSPGLASFMDARIGSTTKLAELYAARRDYYQAIKPAMLALAADPAITAAVRAAFVRINQWIPEARFPETFLVIGRMNSAGTTGSAGLLIGLEMFGRTPDAPLDRLDRWARFALHTPDDLVFTIVHESIHTLQRSSNRRTLLEASIHEGMCDFIAGLATGTTRDSATYRYARANQAALWQEFTAAMRGTDWDGWLYSTPNDPNRPPDLGYAVGFLICEAFYARATDKAAAIRAMLELRDAEAFLAQSGYAGGN